MALNKSKDKIDVEIKRKRLTPSSLFHKKEIREAAQALEAARLHFKEEEILYGARVQLEVHYDTIEAVAYRKESDREYNARQAEIVKAEEAKIRRAEAKKIRDAARIATLQKEKEKEALEEIKRLSKQLGLTPELLVDKLKEK